MTAYDAAGNEVDLRDVLDTVTDAPAERLSSWARRQQRRHPVRLRVDEFGYDRQGNYFPQYDGGAE